GWGEVDRERRAGSEVGDAGQLPTTDDPSHSATAVGEALPGTERQIVAVDRRENVPSYLLGVAAVEGRVVRILRTAHDRHIVERTITGVFELNAHAVRIALESFQLELVDGGIAGALQYEDIRPRLIRPSRLDRAQLLN